MTISHIFKCKMFLLSLIPLVFFVLVYVMCALFNFALDLGYFEFSRLDVINLDDLSIGSKNAIYRKEYVYSLILTAGATALSMAMMFGIAYSLRQIFTYRSEIAITRKSRYDVIILLSFFLTLFLILFAIILLKPTLGKVGSDAILTQIENFDCTTTCTRIWLALYVLTIFLAIYWASVVTSICALIFVTNSEIIRAEHTSPDMQGMEPEQEILNESSSTYPDDQQDQEEENNTLKEKHSVYKSSLYTAAVVYSIGVIVIYHLYSWPTIFIQNAEENLKPAANLAEGIATYWMITFSVYIISAFLPAGFLLRQWSEESGIKDESKSSWLDDLKEVVAFVSPIIAGVVGISIDSYLKLP